MSYTVHEREVVEVAPPVHNFTLHRDILWNIFMLNADMDAPTNPDLPYNSARGTRQFVFSPLTVLQCSSQVCRSWRAIILQAPSLWSRVIDMDVLRISPQKWREEVMERTGEAPLHVKGCIDESGDESLFVWIISKFGARIRNLDVVGEPNSSNLASAISFLQYPAPCLESFKLQIDGVMPLGNSNFSLFSDNAPSLRSYFHTGILFNIGTPWLSNLCNLYICSHIGLCRLLEILSRTPRLQFLKVERGVLDNPRSEVPLRHATLTHLKEIEIYHSNNQHAIMKVEVLTIMEAVFSRYTQYYFTSNAPRQLSLEIGHEAFILSARLHPTHKGLCPDFVLSAVSHGGVSQEFLQVVLSPFLSCDVKRITHLDLDLIFARRRLGQSATNLKTLLTSLTNVQKLHTTANTLQILSEYDRPIFPVVHTISFRYFMPGGAKALYGFISSRMKFSASTIRTLDFTRSNAPQSYFLQFVQHLPDVEILPKRRSVCQDGSVLEHCNMDL